jgi:TnpA family transposase
MSRDGDRSHRLAILTASEIDDLFGLPCFTDENRRLYFDLSAVEQEAARAYTFTVAAHFVLQLGYFKAKQQFFVYEQEAVLKDLRHIVGRHFPDKDLARVKMPSKPTRLSQQRIILKLMRYRFCDNAAQQALERKALSSARLSAQPVFLLREILQHLSQERIVAPAYGSLQDLVGRVVTSERDRIDQMLGRALRPAIQERLDSLFEADEYLYRVSALRKEPRDFSYKELRREVERRKLFQPLHAFAQSFLEKADISMDSRKYYASLIKFYTVYKLKRMAGGPARLYLLCFAYYRFRQINDNLIDAFIHLVDQYEQQAKLAAEQAVQQALSEAAGNLQAAGQVLTLFVDPSIPANAPFSAIKKKAFSLLGPDQFPLVSDYMRNIEFDKTSFEWSCYTKLSFTFKRNLRHLFAELEFAGRVENHDLLKAAAFLQDLLRQGKSPRQSKPAAFPVAVVPKSLKPYLFTAGPGKEKKLEVDRYEFLVYRLLRNALQAGDVFVRDSAEFRSFEDDLISDALWKNKEAVLREIRAPILLKPIEETLKEFHETLEAKIETVNRRITDGANTHIKLKGRQEKRRWTLVYPEEEAAVNSPFYSQLPSIGIADLLWFVAENTGFLDAFTHVLDRYIKRDIDPRLILACIVALGTNMGLWKMAEVSGLSHASLLATARDFLRLETLHPANDAISNATAALPVFRLFDIRDAIHSSSDGQRIETQINTINARYSPKYFGLQKGVSSYTLVANHVPVNAKIIGTHEHESHYVFDVLYNNSSEIKPERHSTDTHGANHVNFWILHAFGYRFAPRYRDLKKKTATLIGFQHPSCYGDLLIRPSRKAFDDLIRKEWGNIQRIMASLAHKDVTQATIVRKLSSYARQNQTKKALWELDNLCRTLYVLDFIDDPELRQSVQKALNRGEAYHRLRRAVAYVNGGKFRVKTETEQQIWNECSRLLTNAIIYYNAALLSRVYEQKQAAGDREATAAMASISPVAWQHVNLFGVIEFSRAMSPVDLNALAARYADPVRWRKAFEEELEAALA